MLSSIFGNLRQWRFGRETLYSSRSDDNPLAVVKGYFIPVKDSSAQDVLVTDHDNGGGWDRGEAEDLEFAKIGGK